jgi:hexosaminidase
MKYFLSFLLASLAPAASLMPMPAKVTPAEGAMPIASMLRVTLTGTSDVRLKSAGDRLVMRVSRQTGIPPIHTASDPTLTINVKAGSPEWPTLGEDESYELQITPQGAQLTAPTTTGALRGMETFAQLIVPAKNGFEAPSMTIADHPRYPWRGLMLDVSRHWMPLDVVLRNLDGMAAVKLNVFHWHLSDDQGFRVESKRFPRLQQLGSDGFFYTQDDVRQVEAYARDRGIRVVPEFDIPGHTTAWFAAYPELASAPGPYTIERFWGIFKPTMDPSNEAVYTFLDAFLQEMTALFPDPYFHIGGDEVEGSAWKQSAAIQKFARENHLANQEAIHGYFNGRVQAMLKKYGKIMIGWDEVLQPGLAPDTVIQSWRGPSGLAAAAKADYRGLLSYGYYLDHLRPASYHYGIDPDNNQSHDPHVLGGEACMWNEYVSSENVDSRIWPRMIAIAERFWSPRDVQNVDSMYDRMESVSRQLDFVGLQHHTYQGEMLARIAGIHPAEPFQILADALETAPVQTRRSAQKYSSLIPLNRMVDAVHPESEFVRELELAVKRGDEATVRAVLTVWAKNDERIFAPDELKVLSKNLSAAATIALQALDYAGKDPKGWRAQQLEALDAMSKPSAELILAAIRPIKLILTPPPAPIAATPRRPR